MWNGFASIPIFTGMNSDRAKLPQISGSGKTNLKHMEQLC